MRRRACNAAYARLRGYLLLTPSRVLWRGGARRGRVSSHTRSCGSAPLRPLCPVCLSWVAWTVQACRRSLSPGGVLVSDNSYNPQASSLRSSHSLVSITPRLFISRHLSVPGSRWCSFTSSPWPPRSSGPLRSQPRPLRQQNPVFHARLGSRAAL